MVAIRENYAFRNTVVPSPFAVSDPISSSAITIQFTTTKPAPKEQEEDRSEVLLKGINAQSYNPQSDKEKGIYNRYMALQSGLIDHKKAVIIFGRILVPESYSVDVKKLQETMRLENEPTLGEIKKYFALEDGDIRGPNKKLWPWHKTDYNFDNKTPSKFGLKKLTIPAFRMNMAINVVEGNKHGKQYIREVPVYTVFPNEE